MAREFDGDPALGWDRGAVPEVLEDSSAAAWSEYLASLRALDLEIARNRQQQRRAKEVAGNPADARRSRVLDAMRESRRRRSLDGAATSRNDPVPPAEPLAQPTVDEVMQLARRDGRICPLPPHWARLIAVLTAGQAPHFARPEDLPCWRGTDLERAHALRLQVEEAARRDLLAPIHQLLAELPESGWHHLPRLHWPRLA